MKNKVWVRQKKKVGKNKFSTVTEDMLYTAASPSKGDYIKIVNDVGAVMVHGEVLNVTYTIHPDGTADSSWDVLVE